MILAVSGGKGGVGKTTVSMNLGVELDAVVVDGDLTTADLPHGNGPDMHDVLAGRANPHEAIEERGSMQIVSCGRSLEGARAADLSKLPDVVTELERRCGNVLIDSPAGLARDVGTIFEVADSVVLVTTPDDIAMMDAARTREVAMDFDTSVAAVVINKVPVDSVDTEAVLDDAEDRFRATAVAVPERTEIAQSQEYEELITEYAPESPAADSFSELSWILKRNRKWKQI